MTVREIWHDGQLVGTEHVPDDDIPADGDDPVAAAVSIVREEVSARLDSSVTSIAKLKTAFIEGLDAAAARAGG